MPSGACSSIRGGEGEVLLVSRMSENGELATRARPLKPHETEPFLTVGLADINTYGTRERSSASVPPGEGAITARGRLGSGDSRYGGGQADRSTVASTGAVLYSLYMSQSVSMGKENRGSEGPGTSRMPGSTFSSSSHTQNPCVKMPFKHDIRKPSQTQWQEPAQDLREMTALATYHMTQMLGEDAVTLTKKQRGRLQQKGKLKPLYPVDVSGPSISQCRGILAETRSYSASASRTLQRRRHIVSQLKSGALKLGHKPSPRQDGTESVHRVSAASSVEDLAGEEEGGGGCKGGEKGVFLNDDFQAELASMERDALFEMEDKESSSKDETEEAKENNLKEADPTPLSPAQGISSKQNPDLGSPNPTHPSDSKPDAQKTEEGRKDLASQQPLTTPSGKALKNSMPSNNGIPEGSDQENRTQDPHTQEGNPATASDRSEKNTSHNLPVKIRRPVSAGVDSSFSPLSTLEVKTRPQTAASAKTVRFANHAHSSDGKRLPVSRSNTWMGRGRGKRPEDKGRSKERKSSAGESCKPFDLDKNGGDDEDEGQGRGGKNSRGGGRTGNGRTGSGSTKATPQGGQNRGQGSGSPHSPQDVEDTPCFSSLTALLQSLSEEPKPVSLVQASENQPSTFPQRNGESRTVHSNNTPGIDLISMNKANKSVSRQCPSDPQKLSIYQEDENDSKPDINSPPYEKMLKRGFTLYRKRMCLRKLSSEQKHAHSEQKLAQSHDSQRSVCQFCGKDTVGHKCSNSDDKHRSVLRGNSSEWNARDGTKLPEGHVSPSVQLWTWLGLHCPSWFFSLLVL